jgi:Zn-finger nucleic acid-binding protein
VTSLTTCPACGAPITPRPDTEGYHCDYCHAVFYPGEDDDGVQIASDAATAQQACPICSLPLVQASIAKIPLLFCTQCHGLLLPMPALQSLIEARKADRDKPAVQAPPDHADLKRSIQCPQCHRRMDTHFYAGPGNVIVDSCGDCTLLWLDRGELTRIAHAPDEGDQEDLTW